MAKHKQPTRKERLSHILEAIDKVLEFTEGMDVDKFVQDERTQLAIIKLFEIMGEAAYKLDEEYKEAQEQVEWRKIEGLRHILVHDYYRVQPNILWNTKNMYLPDFRDKIVGLLLNE